MPKKKTVNGHKKKTSTTSINERDKEAIRQRLIAIRKVFGKTQTAFARWLGIGSNRWNNYETKTAFTLPMAFLLVERINGLTIGYITQGHTDRLPTELKQQLSKFDKEIFGGPRESRPHD